MVVKEWDRLDRNRERRERDHENLRGDVPLEYMAVPEPGIVPRWLNHPTVRQMSSGNFLDLIFDCPYEMHNLTANAFLSRLIQSLSEEHKGSPLLSLPPALQHHTACRAAGPVRPQHPQGAQHHPKELAAEAL